MNKFVLGFLFNSSLDKVALIYKNHPSFQAGKLNGIGGKVKEGELLFQAMTREFQEEAGMEIVDWLPACEFGDKTFHVNVFTTIGDLSQLQSLTSEQTISIFIETLNAFPLVDMVEEIIKECINVIKNKQNGSE